MKSAVTQIAPPLLGFFIMAAIGWNLAPQKPVDSEPDSEKPVQRDRQRTERKSSRENPVVSAQMNAIRHAGSPSDRLRATIALVNSLPPSEFAKWAEGDRFNFRNGPELLIFRRILFERWINESPETLIPWAGENNYGQAGRALAQIASQNPQSLIDYYRAHPNPKTELETLDQIAKHHPEIALQRLQELSAEGLFSGTARATKKLLSELAKKSPAALEAAMKTLSPDLQKSAEKALIGERLTASFPTEVRALFDRPDGWQIFADVSEDSKLAAQLIDHIGELPASWKASMAENSYRFIYQNSKKWFETDLESVGFSAEQAKNIRGDALTNLVHNDPEFALKNISNPGIPSHLRSYLITQAISTAKGDSEKAEKLLAQIESEEDRQLARDQFKLTELAATQSDEQKPKEWLEKLGSVGQPGTYPYQVLNQLKTWDKNKIAELRTNFNQLPLEQQQNIALAISSVGMHSQIDTGFAGDAIRSFVVNSPATPPTPTTPGNREADPVMASSTYAVRLATTDPAAATEWITTLPEGNAKLWAFKNVAANWTQYDPNGVKDWLKTLPSETRQQVTEYLGSKR